MITAVSRSFALLTCALAAACASSSTGPMPRFLPETDSTPSLAGAEGLGPAGVQTATVSAPGPNPGAESGSDQLPTELGDPILARIGGREILTSDLLEGLLFHEGDLLRIELNLLIGSALAKLEAERLGLRLDAAVVDERASTNLGEFVRRNVPEGSSLEEFLKGRMGVEPELFRSRLRNNTVREIVTERVVRAHTLSNEFARVRILVADSEGAAEAESRFAAGEDFELLVRELSRDATAERGGLLPFLGRTERSPISNLAFRTPVGELGGPLELGGATILLKVEVRPEPLQGDWEALSDAVLASLAADRVGEEEFVFWQVSMERRYTVDLAPMRELLPGIVGS